MFFFYYRDHKFFIAHTIAHFDLLMEFYVTRTISISCSDKMRTLIRWFGIPFETFLATIYIETISNGSKTWRFPARFHVGDEKTNKSGAILVNALQL